jgi:hypothetical protein
MITIRKIPETYSPWIPPSYPTEYHFDIRKTGTRDGTHFQHVLITRQRLHFVTASRSLAVFMAMVQLGRGFRPPLEPYRVFLK